MFRVDVKGKVRAEAYVQIKKFVDQSVNKLESSIVESLPNKKVVIDLVAKVTNIEINYLRIGLFQDEYETSSLSTKYPIKLEFKTKESTNLSLVDKVGVGMINVSFESTGLLDGVHIAETTCGVGANIRSITFNFSISGKVVFASI